MKRIRILQGLGGLLALALSATAQTATGFAPSNFGNVILTSTPSNATGASGVSNVFTSSGSQFTFGTGGTLVNPAQFNYVVTGPNTATISSPAAGNTPASTTNLVFTSANGGNYTTVSGSNTTTGRFGLAAIPSSAPIENVSARSTISANGSTTVGFVIAGTMPRRVLVRAVGPGLAAFGVTNALTNPSLTLYRGTQMIARNDDWGNLQAVTSASASTGGTGTSTGSTSSGTSSGTGSTGTGSTSGGMSSGTGSTATGSTSGGMSSGTGSMSSTGSNNGFFTGTLSDGGTFTTQLATANDFTSSGAFALTQGSKDSGFVVTLPPGAYTVVVANSSTVTASAGSASGGTSSGSGSTATGSTSGGTSSGTGSTAMGSTSGGTSSGSTSSGGTSTSTGSTSTGSTSGGTSSGSTSTGGTSTSTGSTSGGTSSGGTTTGGTSTGTGSTGSAATGTTTTGDVLVEVYFME